MPFTRTAGTAALHLALLLALAGPASAAGAPRILMLDPQYDASASASETPQTERTDRARLAMVAERLRAALSASGAYEVLDAPEIAREIGKYNLGACGRCELMLGRKAGADRVLIVNVQKISALLINLQVFVYAVEDGATLAGGVTVIHSNAEEEWRRAIDKIAERRLGLPKPG